ncbi:MAG TPA: sigma-54 dependent transcriptional regulator [Candidatus Acidoferrales bacterium]|jgi:two-component system response regulator AtoC|nr:sigma-54 dependent transcriptional regulator [Candidatus Acidoferrales bacterium]
MKPTLLIVDDEKTTREGLRAALEERYDVYIAEDAKAAMGLLESENFDVLLTDFRLPNEDGMKLIARAKSLPKPPVCILMTAYGSEELAVNAMKQGADDYIAKGRLQIDELEMRIARALKQQNLEVENVSLRKQLDSKFGLENIIGESPVMQEIFDVVKQVAPTRATVLIGGESGTGKELIAKALHQLSPRAKQPFVTVHCAALAPTLLESELFGHERGAFTGAHERRIGRFEQAQGGTLFLDEIGEIDATIQVKLLRFLGERTFERVGSNKTQTADVRLVAATNKRLEELVKAGKFREDLFFRLRVVEIELPPLRERTGDIPLLAQGFLREFAKENGKPVTDFTADALEALMNFSWPGNVRELRTAIEHAVVLARGERITRRDLPASVRHDGAELKLVTGKDLTVKAAEKQLIIRALKETDGNRTHAAKKIGMSRRTFHRKLHEYHLEGF